MGPPPYVGGYSLSLVSATATHGFPIRETETLSKPAAARYFKDVATPGVPQFGLSGLILPAAFTKVIRLNRTE